MQRLNYSLKKEPNYWLKKEVVGHYIMSGLLEKGKSLTQPSILHVFHIISFITILIISSRWLLGLPSCFQVYISRPKLYRQSRCHWFWLFVPTVFYFFIWSSYFLHPPTPFFLLVAKNFSAFLSSSYSVSFFLIFRCQFQICSGGKYTLIN